jgi:4-amino-4-deoxy-L-arabinose transferase-like glycosyltransferase
MPVFVDEGNYIIWAKQLLTQGAYFITLTDGKPPLPTWGTALFIYFTPQQMLLGLRLFSVFTGYIASVGFFILGYLLFGKKTAFISTLLYILTPFILFYDRIGLVDSFANATSLFILIGSIILIKNRTLWSSILFGVFCGIGLLVKSNIWLPIYFSFFAPILNYRKSHSAFTRETARFIVLFIISIVISQVIFRIQLFAPYPDPLKLVSNKNGDFLYPLSELLANPVGLFIKNVPERVIDLMQMTGWITFIIGVIGFISLFRKNKLLTLYLFIWFAAPLFAITFMVKYYAARYMIFLATMIVLLAGYFISQNKNKVIASLIGLLILISYIYFDYPILFDYSNLHFPRFEREQYVEGIGSGYGISDISEFTISKSKEKPVIILGEGIFGLGSYIVESAMPLNEKNVQVIGLWPFDKKALKSYQNQLKTHTIYVVMNGQTVKNVPRDWPLKLIKKYKKPYNNDYFSLYELIIEK